MGQIRFQSTSKAFRGRQRKNLVKDTFLDTYTFVENFRETCPKVLEGNLKLYQVYRLCQRKLPKNARSCVCLH